VVAVFPMLRIAMGSSADICSCTALLALFHISSLHSHYQPFTLGRACLSLALFFLSYFTLSGKGGWQRMVILLDD